MPAILEQTSPLQGHPPRLTGRRTWRQGKSPPPFLEKAGAQRGLGEACPETRAQQEGVQTQGQWAQGEGKPQGVAVPQEGCCGGRVWPWGSVNSSLLEGPQG